MAHTLKKYFEVSCSGTFWAELHPARDFRRLSFALTHARKLSAACAAVVTVHVCRRVAAHNGTAESVMPVAIFQRGEQIFSDMRVAQGV